MLKEACYNFFIPSGTSITVPLPKREEIGLHRIDPSDPHEILKPADN